METIIEITRFAGDNSVHGVFDVVDGDTLRLIGAEVNRNGVELSLLNPYFFYLAGSLDEAVEVLDSWLTSDPAPFCLWSAP